MPCRVISRVSKLRDIVKVNKGFLMFLINIYIKYILYVIYAVPRDSIANKRVTEG